MLEFLTKFINENPEKNSVLTSFPEDALTAV